MLRAKAHTPRCAFADCEVLLAISEDGNVLLPRKAHYDMRPVPTSNTRNQGGSTVYVRQHLRTTSPVQPQIKTTRAQVLHLLDPSQHHV